MIQAKGNTRSKSNRPFGKTVVWLTVLMSVFMLNIAGAAQAHDADHKRVISKWRSDGLMFSLNENTDFVQGAMKGTFIVQDNRGVAHYMHAAQMTCPFWVRIDKDGQDELQGVCHLTNEKGDTADAKFFSTGDRENFTGIWTFTSGTGNLKGIQGGGPLNLRVDLIKEQITNGQPEYFATNVEASGYLNIRELRDNVVDNDRFPEVQ